MNGHVFVRNKIGACSVFQGL